MSAVNNGEGPQAFPFFLGVNMSREEIALLIARIGIWVSVACYITIATGFIFTAQRNYVIIGFMYITYAMAGMCMAFVGSEYR